MYGHVITKFSRMVSLPHFLTNGAQLRALRARELRHYMISCGIAKVATLSEQKPLMTTIRPAGLKMIDIQSFNASLKMKRVQSYLNTQNKGKWKVFVDYYLESYGGNYCSCAI